MIEVEVGNTIVEFPDGTSPEIMRDALRKQFGGPAAPAPASTSASGLPDWLLKMHEEGKKGLSQAVGSTVAGLTPRDPTQEGQLGSLLKTGSGLLSAANIPLSYPVSAAASGISQLMAPAIHGAGSVLNPEVAKAQQTEDIYQQILPDVNTALMGIAGGPRARLPPVSQPPPVGAAAARLTEAGMPIDFPSIAASPNLAAQQTGMILRNIPVVGDPIIKKTERAIEQMGKAVSETARRQGDALPEDAGEIASTAIKDWITGTSKATVTKAYDAVDNLVNPQTRTDLAETRAQIANIAARRQNARLGSSKAADEVLEAVQDPAGLDYPGIKDLRTHIGKMMEDPTVESRGMSEVELKQIYGSLTKDMRINVSQAGGPPALSAWERANKLAAAVQDRRNELARIVGVHMDAPATKVFDKLKQAANIKTGDTALLMKAKKTIGSDWDEVVSGITGRLGINAKGNFSPAIYLNDWERMSNAGKSALYGTGAHRKALDDIATLSKQHHELQKFANPSGTGRTSFAALGLTGFMAEPFTAASMALGGNLLSRVLARPAPASSLAHWMRTYTRTLNTQSPSAGAALTIATRNLANTINDTLGADISPRDFLDAIQGQQGEE